MANKKKRRRNRKTKKRRKIRKTKRRKKNRKTKKRRKIRKQKKTKKTKISETDELIFKVPKKWSNNAYVDKKKYEK